MSPDNDDSDIDNYDDIFDLTSATMFARQGEVVALLSVLTASMYGSGSLATAILRRLDPIENSIIREFMTFRNLSCAEQEALGAPTGEQVDQAWRDLLRVVKLLLFLGADVRYAALHQFTMYREAYDIISLLLHFGADPDSRDRNGATALSYAISSTYSSDAIVRLLIEHGANPNATTRFYGKSALMVAVENDSPELVNLLIGADADVNRRDEEGRTAVMLALLPDEIPETVLSILLDAGADLNLTDNRGYNAADYAIFAKMGGRALPPAIQFSQMFLDILNATTRGKARLLSGYRLGEIPGRILDNALAYAVRRNHFDCADLLLKNGADINGIDFDGWRPLVKAAFGLQITAVQFLLDHGADASGTNVYGRGPLHYVCSDLLAGRLQHENRAALHLTVAMLLIDSGAEINVRDDKGYTPLYLAVYSGFHDLARSLIANGADATIPDMWGITPIELAKKSVRMRASLKGWLKYR